ncbi:MAG: LptE family protein [Odoribacter sp.]|nr:LptE family protein [Odoribacter sp.]
MTKYKFIFILIIIILSCAACRFMGVTVTYNMTGGSLNPEIKTFSVDYFPNKAPLVMPTLSTTFTEKLTEYIRQKTGLTQLTDNNGDIRFEGQITEYSQRPIDITSDEIASSNRLTIGIRVKYTNTIDDKFDFSSTFSNYADYSTEVDFNSVEESLIEEILDKIIDDIYNKAIVNW